MHCVEDISVRRAHLVTRRLRLGHSIASGDGQRRVVAPLLWRHSGDGAVHAVLAWHEVLQRKHSADKDEALMTNACIISLGRKMGHPCVAIRTASDWGEPWRVGT